MTSDQLLAMQAYAQAVAMHAASYPEIPGSTDCENCRHATGVSLLIAAALMRCDVTPDPVQAIDHLIAALKLARDAVVAARAPRGEPS